MKIETTLRAMEKAHLKAILITKQPQRMRRYRQFYAFRDRIIRMDEEKKDLIDQLFLKIGDRERIIRERTARIADLEVELNTAHRITTTFFGG